MTPVHLKASAYCMEQLGSKLRQAKLISNYRIEVTNKDMKLSVYAQRISKNTGEYFWQSTTKTFPTPLDFEDLDLGTYEGDNFQWKSLSKADYDKATTERKNKLEAEKKAKREETKSPEDDMSDEKMFEDETASQSTSKSEKNVEKKRSTETSPTQSQTKKKTKTTIKDKLFIFGKKSKEGVTPEPLIIENYSETSKPLLPTDTTTNTTD